MNLYVISKKDTTQLKKEQKYKIVDADYYDYKIEYETNKYMWIDKGDTENFDYHV